MAMSLARTFTVDTAYATLDTGTRMGVRRA